MKKIFSFMFIICAQMSFASEGIDLGQIYESDFKTNTLVNSDNWEEIGENIKTLIRNKSDPAYSKRTTRETWNFGNSFYHVAEESGLPEHFDPPQWLEELGRDVVQQYAEFLPEGYTVDNYIVSVYEAGHELTPHFDFGRDNTPHHNKYPYNKGDLKFYYDDYVFGLIVSPDSEGKLYWLYDSSEDSLPKTPQEPHFILDEKEGDTYFFKDNFRKHPWYHGVSKVKDRRVSITFRLTKFYYQEGAQANRE